MANCYTSHRHLRPARFRGHLSPLEVILDLTLTLVDERQYFSKRNQRHQRDLSANRESGELTNGQQHHYDGDDEGSDEQFIFPCHLSCENCHPDQLLSYHFDHLKANQHVPASGQIIKHSKLAEFVIHQLAENVRSVSFENSNTKTCIAHSNLPRSPISHDQQQQQLANIDLYLRYTVNMFLKLKNVSIIKSIGVQIGPLCRKQSSVL